MLIAFVLVPLNLAYGSSYDRAACNGLDKGVHGTLPVASQAACEGGYAGLFDLSGNLWEWEDSCDNQADASLLCHSRGGSYLNADSELACNSVSDDRPDLVASIGIRCCAE